jgi:putative transposase
VLGRNLWAGAALFDRIEAVQASATRWLWTYKNERPNMVLDGITPSMKLVLAA